MPPKIKIITGPIGSGKTTILNRIKESYERKEIFIGQKVGFFGEPTDSTVANALLKDMYSKFPFANDQFETLQKYLMAVEANDLCNALSSSEYDIVYFDTSVLYGVVFLQTANDLKIINNQTYSNCLTFYYQMISNINFENAEVTNLKVIPHIGVWSKLTKEVEPLKSVMSTFADLRSVSGGLLGGMGSIGVAALGAYFIYTSEIGSVDFNMGVGFAAFGCLLVSDHYSK
ncbi:hypothetical protein DDB_G0294238 [Dictyostelium discoideum AX4]|uniref:Uncharacterized protein n=1 Tax=Dictyostelium discoideum TaxID=44689 RepID=Q54AS7_DICDI|nr:hypothetical protein DDB_G0294238 [Dictyostelium discoideum AX4]EAL60363.1 hypothetical protein DDB_G0294238 [Dictyostelium discoideum AX4]|eukprot:XP_628776.1 hypothetical protein DDB_G0294238 [Dictyostelium discoideum AX4]